VTRAGLGGGHPGGGGRGGGREPVAPAEAGGKQQRPRRQPAPRGGEREAADAEGHLRARRARRPLTRRRRRPSPTWARTAGSARASAVSRTPAWPHHCRRWPRRAALRRRRAATITLHVRLYSPDDRAVLGAVLALKHHPHIEAAVCRVVEVCGSGRGVAGGSGSGGCSATPQCLRMQYVFRGVFKDAICLQRS